MYLTVVRIPIPVTIDLGGFLPHAIIAEQPRSGYERLAVEPTPRNDTTDVRHL